MTNRYDQDSVTKIQELADIVKANDDLRTISTHCAHIFPDSEATNLSIEPGSSKVCPFFSLSFITLDENYSFIALPCRFVVGSYGTLWPKKHSWRIKWFRVKNTSFGKCNDCGCWFSKSIQPIKSLVCSNCASELVPILDCLTTTDTWNRLGRMKKINTSSNRHLSVSYVAIKNMQHSRPRIQLNIPFHLDLILRFTLHVPKSHIYQERVSILTNFTKKWRTGKPLTQMAALQICWNMSFSD